jgi:hypothetical protein
MPSVVDQLVADPEWDNLSRVERAKARESLFVAYLEEDPAAAEWFTSIKPEQQGEVYAQWQDALQEKHGERFKTPGKVYEIAPSAADVKEDEGKMFSVRRVGWNPVDMAVPVLDVATEEKLAARDFKAWSVEDFARLGPVLDALQPGASDEGAREAARAKLQAITPARGTKAGGGAAEEVQGDFPWRTFGREIVQGAAAPARWAERKLVEHAPEALTNAGGGTREQALEALDRKEAIDQVNTWVAGTGGGGRALGATLAMIGTGTGVAKGLGARALTKKGIATLAAAEGATSAAYVDELPGFVATYVREKQGTENKLRDQVLTAMEGAGIGAAAGIVLRGLGVAQMKQWARTNLGWTGRTMGELKDFVESRRAMRAKPVEKNARLGRPEDGKMGRTQDAGPAEEGAAVVPGDIQAPVEAPATKPFTPDGASAVVADVGPSPAAIARDSEALAPISAPPAAASDQLQATTPTTPAPGPAAETLPEETPRALKAQEKIEYKHKSTNSAADVQLAQAPDGTWHVGAHGSIGSGSFGYAPHPMHDSYPTREQALQRGLMDIFTWSDGRVLTNPSQADIAKSKKMKAWAAEKLRALGVTDEQMAAALARRDALLKRATEKPLPGDEGQGPVPVAEPIQPTEAEGQTAEIPPPAEVIPAADGEAPAVAKDPAGKPAAPGAPVAAVVPTPETERKVSQLADSKQLKVQKEYLYDAVNYAAKSAPEAVIMEGYGKALTDELDKREAAYDKARQGGVPGEIQAAETALNGQYLHTANQLGLSKEWKGEKKTAREYIRGQLQAKHSPNVVFEVPGDGTFRIINSKTHLKAFAEVVRKRFGKGLKATEPQLPATSMKPVGKVAKNPSVDDITEAVELVVPDAAMQKRTPRPILAHVLSEDGLSIATNGRILTVARGGGGETREAIKQAEKADYPAWRQVLPNIIHATGGQVHVDATPAGWTKITVDTADAIKLMHRIGPVVEDAPVVGGEARPVVRIHNADGALGVSAHSPSFGDFWSENVKPKHPVLMGANPELFATAMHQARALGAEQVTMYFKAGEKPTAVITDGRTFAQVFMPVAMDEATEKAIAKGPDAWAEATSEQPAKPKKKAGSSGSSPAMAAQPLPAGAQELPPNMQPPPTSTALAPADNPNFSQIPIGLREMVQMVRALAGGRYPAIRAKLASRMSGGEVLGRAHLGLHRKDKPSVSLKADLFKVVSDEERNLLARQAQQYRVDQAAADPTLDAERLTQIESERYDYLLEQAQARNLAREPQAALYVLAHEIGHWVDWLPDETLKRGNILGRIASLKTMLKGSMPALPDGDDPLTPKERAKLRRKAEKEVGPRPAKDEAADRAAWSEEVSKVYRGLVEEEMQERDLVSAKVITAELDALTAWWNGTTVTPDYFLKPEERYAETFSVILNNPAAVAKRAPIFWRSFLGYLGEKPQVKAEWERMQDLIRSGQANREAVTNLREMWRRSNEAGVALEAAEGKLPLQGHLDAFRMYFDRNFGPLYRRTKRAKLASGDEAEAAVEDYLYRATAHESALRALNLRVLAPLAQAGLDFQDLGEVLFHRRVVLDPARADKANPDGWTPVTSKARLAEMERDLGPARWAVLEEARQQFRQVYVEQALQPLADSGVLDPEQLQMLQERIDYATFKRRDDWDPTDAESIEGQLRLRFGSHVTSQIYHSVGTLGQVVNPLVATVQKMLSLQNMAYREAAKGRIVQFLNEAREPMLAEAEYTWNETARRREPVEVNNQVIGTIPVLQGGQVKHYYVPRAIAEMFATRNSAEMLVLSPLFRATAPIKALFTELNYGFWPRAFWKDTRAAARQLPGGRWLFGRNAILPAALRNLVAASRSIGGKPDPVADAALRRLMVISRADPRGEATSPDELERLLIRYGQNPASWQGEQKRIHRLFKLWHWYKTRGQVAERAVKMAAMQQVDRMGPALPEWQKRRLVREHGGSPSFLQKGKGVPLLDLAMMFYNPWKESWRSQKRAAMRDPRGYFWRWLKMGGAGAVGYWMLERGMFQAQLGEERSKEFQRMLESIPERDKLQGYAVPMGWVDKDRRKVAYLLLPFDDNERMLNATLRKSLQQASGDSAGAMGLDGLINWGGQDLPGMNPLLKVGAAWFDYHLLGRNPVDSFTGRGVLKDDEVAAGEGGLPLAQWSFNQLSGGVAGKFQEPSLYDGDPGGLEKFLRWPGVSALVGRWVRVSNRGVVERAENEVAAEIRQKRASARLVGQDIVARLRRGESMSDAQYQLLSVDPYLQAYVIPRANDVMRRGRSLSDDILGRAQSAEEAARLRLWLMERELPVPEDGPGSGRN